jgi:hypothetical protein
MVVMQIRACQRFWIGFGMAAQRTNSGHHGCNKKYRNAEWNSDSERHRLVEMEKMPDSQCSHADTDDVTTQHDTPKNCGLNPLAQITAKPTLNHERQKDCQKQGAKDDGE